MAIWNITISLFFEAEEDNLCFQNMDMKLILIAPIVFIRVFSFYNALQLCSHPKENTFPRHC